MKKVFLTIFIAACLVLCVLPSLGMIFAPSNEPIGNEKETKFPALADDSGKLNTAYPTQLGEYYEQHFAFRPLAITADANIQASVFTVSNNDSVVVGKDGWLYYSSTLDNYLGKNVFSDRKTSSIVHNLEMLQSFSKSRDANFIFTVAPNKNTLYPKHMPYYFSQKVSSESNRKKISEALAKSEVNYCDLFSLFESKNETLYFARDSHWNNKGALMVYDSVLTQLGKSHDDYSTVESVRKKDFTGDLAKMLYPAGSQPEYNNYYGAEERYSYTTDTKSVEDAMIKTKNEDASESLYMYRDSFGNSLLPFFASAYNTATFTKSFPMLLEKDFNEAKPDTFVLELVERNLDWMCTRPPIISAPELTYLNTDGSLSGKVKVDTKPCEFTPLYTEISGEVECDGLKDDTEFCVSITDKDGKSKIYEAYNICTEESEFAFAAYLPREVFSADSNENIKIIAKTNDNYYDIGE